MIRLIAMRHGNTFEKGELPIQIGARTDLALTSFGRAQAENMGEYLAQQKIFPNAIFSGSLKRQKESAEIVGKFFGLPLQVVPALTEIDYGDWEGLSADEISKKWPKEYVEWNQKSKWQRSIFQGNFEMHFQNLYSWVSSLAAEFDGKTVLAVTSGGVLRFLRNEKVKTGHFCELHFSLNELKVYSWNQPPLIASKEAPEKL